VPSVESSGARIVYERTGTGPPVILVQGVGVIGRGWTPQVAALSGDHTVITIDNRGIGESTAGRTALSIEAMAADVLAVADAEGIERFHLAGHSMGGVIAQHIALSARSRVLTLALLCTFLRGRQGATMSAGLLLTALRSRIGTRRMRRHAFLEIILPPAYLAGRERDVVCRELEILFGRDLADSPAILMQQLRAMSRFDASARLGALAGLPTLVVSASQDRIARPEYGRALASAIPGAVYVEVPGAGHAVPIHAAAAVNDVLARHIRSAALTP
jgi:aminoacrylate hydrolase